MFAITTKTIAGSTTLIEASADSGYRVAMPVKSTTIESHRMVAEALLKVIAVDPQNTINFDDYTLYSGSRRGEHVFVLVPDEV